MILHLVELLDQMRRIDMDLLQEKLLASTDFSSWEKHVVYFCVLAMRDAHKDEVEKAVGTLGLETIKKFFE